MIEDYQTKRRRDRLVARGLLAGGVVLAVLAAIATYVFVSAERGGGPLVARTSVLVAARDIAARTTIAPDDVKVVELEAAVIPAGALRVPADAVGRVATVPIATNEVVLAAKFVAAGGGTPFSVLPAGEVPSGTTPDWRAFSLTIADANAVGGALQSGDVVDVVVAVGFDAAQARPGAANQAPDAVARTTAERVPILARAGTIYVLRVDAQQAERIAVLQTAGATIHLLLRAPGDARNTRARGALGSSEAAELIRGIPTPAPGAR